MKLTCIEDKDEHAIVVCAIVCCLGLMAIFVL